MLICRVLFSGFTDPHKRRLVFHAHDILIPDFLAEANKKGWKVCSHSMVFDRVHVAECDRMEYNAIVSIIYDDGM